MIIMNRKVSVIGAGKVGATTAHILALKGIADVVLVNRTAGIAQGVALDIMESLPIENSETKIIGTGDYSAISGSDIVVVTAGAQRKEGMSRDDLLKMNASIISDIAQEIKKYAPNSIVIVVTNPLDAMAYLLKKITGFGQNRVMGMAGVLDSSRFSSFVADELKISVNDVKPLVLGSHGDSMVPAISQTTVKGDNIAGLMEKERLEKIIARTRDAGAEIIKLEGSSAFYAPASSVVVMIDSILNDKKMVLPCSVYVHGEYSLNDLFIGVPVVLGENGIEKIVEFPLSEDEKKALVESAAKISQSIALLK